MVLLHAFLLLIFAQPLLFLMGGEAESEATQLAAARRRANRLLIEDAKRKILAAISEAESTETAAAVEASKQRQTPTLFRYRRYLIQQLAPPEAPLKRRTVSAYVDVEQQRRSTNEPFQVAADVNVPILNVAEF